MASVIKRRSSSGKVHYYGKYDAGERTPDGAVVWKMVRTGQPSRNAAAVWITAHEKSEREHREHPVEPKAAPLCGPLLDLTLPRLRGHPTRGDNASRSVHGEAAA